MKAVKKTGRPASLDPANKLITIKVTQLQHHKFLELGGSRWVKRQLDEYQLVGKVTAKNSSS